MTYSHDFSRGIHRFLKLEAAAFMRAEQSAKNTNWKTVLNIWIRISIQHAWMAKNHKKKIPGGIHPRSSIVTLILIVVL